MDFNQRILFTVILAVAGVSLTFVRRYKNSDDSAGVVLSGFTLLGIFLLWWNHL